VKTRELLRRKWKVRGDGRGKKIRITSPNWKLTRETARAKKTLGKIGLTREGGKKDNLEAAPGVEVMV